MSKENYLVQLSEELPAFQYLNTLIIKLIRVMCKLKFPEAVHMLEVVLKCCPGTGLCGYGSQCTEAVLGNRKKQTVL